MKSQDSRPDPIYSKRLLNYPIDRMLESGRPDFPFCLCWANENWTRAWDGLDKEVLLKQNYGSEDDKKHIQWLMTVFQDKQYIKIGGKPLLLVYRANRFPDPLRTTSLWREEARKCGAQEPYLCRVESFSDERNDPSKIGFDAAVEFQPGWLKMGTPLRKGNIWRVLRKHGLTSKAFENNNIYDYKAVVAKMLNKPSPPYARFPCVTPSWDGSPRRKKDTVILINSTPGFFGKWLKDTVKANAQKNAEENIIFVNAWNEWGEGNHLEPDRRYGRAYLEAVKEALREGGKLWVAETIIIKILRLADRLSFLGLKAIKLWQFCKWTGAKLWYSVILPVALFPRNCLRRLYRAIKK